MVQITDTAGNDLVLHPPTDAALLAADGKARLNLVLWVRELDTELPLQSLAGTLDWNDGGLVSVFNGASVMEVKDSRDLGPGDYVLQFHARNYALPIPHEAVVNLSLKVQVPPEVSGKKPVVFGPILPRDLGYPGAHDWLFHSGSDLGIIESSLKMLLTTARGERLMEPDYGTNLRQILFESNVQSLDTVISEEIAIAVARWEPRARLESASVIRDPNARAVTVAASFVSAVSGLGFELTLQFVQ